MVKAVYKNFPESQKGPSEMKSSPTTTATFNNISAQDLQTQIYILASHKTHEWVARQQ